MQYVYHIYIMYDLYILLYIILPLTNQLNKINYYMYNYDKHNENFLCDCNQLTHQYRSTFNYTTQ